jgi:hypothetical protein
MNSHQSFYLAEPFNTKDIDECVESWLVRLRLPEALSGAVFAEALSMTLIDIVIVLVVAGLVLWLIDTYIPMAGGIKSLLNVVVFVVVLIWVLQVFGLIGPIHGIRIPTLR